MHLLNITNLDYILMTILFGLIVAISYSFRRKNSGSSDYLMIEKHRLNGFVGYFSGASVGLIEFLVLTSYGAYLGLPALCLFIPVFLFSILVYDQLLSRKNYFEPIILAKVSSYNSRFIFGCYALFLLLASGVAIAIMVTLLKSLLGWEFANSTLSMMGLIAICLLVGGVISVVYNQILVTIVTTALVLLVLVLSYQALGASEFVNNLHAVALSNQLVADKFTKLNLLSINSDLWLLLLASGVFILLNPLYFVKLKQAQQIYPVKKSAGRFWQLLILSMMILLGVFALATPNTQPQLDGQKIITQQTRLEDGSVGYIVKAISSDTPSQQRGIIPLQLDNDNQVTSLDSSQSVFDFSSAGLVMVKHALPYAFVSLFIIALLFYKTISEMISFITIIAIRGFYTPYYNKTKEDLENLWAARVFLFMFMVLAISIGLVLYKFFDLYYMFGLLLMLGLPILLNLIGLRSNWCVDLAAYLFILFVLLCNNVSGVPHLFGVISLPSLWGMIKFSALIISGGYVVFFGITRLLQRGRAND